MKNNAATPWYVWGIIALLSAPPVAVHHGLASIENERAVFSGLSTPDSAIFLAVMDMPSNGFYSPYATCDSEWSDRSARYLAAPLHILYFIAGAVGSGLGFDPFLWLGWLNGLGMAVYLIVVYRFLRNATPRYADAAFVLFTISGGIGGLVVLADIAANIFSEDVVFRLSVYEVMEGAFLFAPAHAHRLYYTLALACGFGFLNAWLIARRMGCSRHAVFAGLLLFGCTLLQPRLGFFFWSAGCCWLLLDTSVSVRARLRQGMIMSLPIVVAACIYLAWSRWNPVFYSNASELVRETVWPIPLLGAAGLHLALAARTILGQRKHLSPLARAATYAATGYLLLFLPLYVAHKVWYGNVWTGGEAAAASTVSDIALLGLVVGLVMALRKRGAPSDTSIGEEPFLLWGLGALVVGVSAWAQGWFMDFAPQRLMLVLGLPLSVAAAMGLAAIGAKRPKTATACWTFLIGFGAASLLANVLFVQGALGRTPGGGPFAEWRRGIIAPEDRQLLEALDDGAVLAPSPFADVVVRNTGNTVLGGTGATDLAGVRSSELQPEIDRFLGTSMPAAERRDFLEHWCVDWIAAPGTWPLPGEVMDEIAALEEVEQAAAFGRGAIYRVIRAPATERGTREPAPN